MDNNTTEEIKSIFKKVFKRLLAKRELNGDDMLLYADICEECTKEKGTYTEDVKTAIKVMKNHNKYCLPNFSTVMRTRQAIQERNPQLKINKVQHIRDKRQMAFEDFFKN